MIGETISHYRIEEKLGAGGMGEVYRALDTRLGRSVAVKRLVPALAGNPKHRKRFEQEARAAALLNHPGIAAVHQLEHVGDELYIIYEYVPGETLRAAIRGGELRFRAIVEIAAGLARALAEAHAHGVAHRDLKPENVMLTPTGQPKILDFGLANLAPELRDEATMSVLLSDPGAIVGTISYMAPEQLEGRETGPRSDIFSFGVMLYEMTAGGRPFAGNSAAGTIAAILATEPAPLECPAELDRIIRKCLRKQASERYQSTEDLAVDLETLLKDSAHDTITARVTAPVPQPLAQLPATSARRHWVFHNLLTICTMSPLAVFLIWKCCAWIAKPESTMILTASMLVMGINVTLRLFLLTVAFMTPLALAREVRRVRIANRVVSWGVIVALVVCGFMVIGEHPVFGAVELGLAAMGAVVVMVITPTVERGVL